jgi:hypothetical protein
MKAVGAERSREPGARMKQWHVLTSFLVLGGFMNL